MPASTINGFTVAYAAVGGAVLWSGITGLSLSVTFRDLLAGNSPSSSASDEPIASTATSSATAAGAATPAAAAVPAAATGTAAANQAIAKVLAAPYGWSAGANWDALVDLWNQESSWSNTARNSSSGAYGIPQAYPPTKMPAAAQAPPVGTSDATAQISWGLSYIKATYGSPSAAWSFDQSDGLKGY